MGCQCMDLGPDVNTLAEFRDKFERTTYKVAKIEAWFATQKRVHPAEMTLKYQRDFDFEIARQYDMYCERRDEENRVLQQCFRGDNLRPIFQRFQSLTTMKVLRGDFVLDGHKHHKDWPTMDSYTTARTEPPQFELCTRGTGVWEHRSPGTATGQYACEQAIIACGGKIKNLEIDHLPWTALQAKSFFAGKPAMAAGKCHGLTKLCLTVAANYAMEEDNEIEDVAACRASMKQGMLKNFIGGLRSLRTLSLAFHNYLYPDYVGAVDLANIVPTNKILLTSLSLEGIETSESTILALLEHSADYLQEIRLRDIYLNPAGSWVRVLCNLRRQCSLTSATFGGYLCDAAYSSFHDMPSGYILGTEDGWHFDHPPRCLSVALETYLIQGGPCPLRHNDKEAVRSGYIDPIAEK